jgi:hypothetical protein
MPSIQDSASVQQTLDFFREPASPAPKAVRKTRPKCPAGACRTLRPEPAFAIAADHLAHEGKRPLPPCAVASIRIEEIRRALAKAGS